MWVAFLLGGPNSTILRCTETTHPQEERISFLQVSQDRQTGAFSSCFDAPKKKKCYCRPPAYVIHSVARRSRAATEFGSSLPPRAPTFSDNAASVCPSDQIRATERRRLLPATKKRSPRRDVADRHRHRHRTLLLLSLLL